MAKSLKSDFFISLKFYADNFFLLAASYVLSPFFIFLILLRKAGNATVEKNLRILVIQTAKIGDMVCTTPVFREIKKKYPDAYLTALVLSKTKGIISGNPHIDKVISLDEPKYLGWGIKNLIKDVAKDKYDWSVCLSPTLLINILPLWSGIPRRVSFTSRYLTKSARLSYIFTNRKKEFLRNRPAFRQYLELLEFLGIKKFDERRELFISRESRPKARDFLLENNISEKDFLIGISVGSGNPIKDWDLEKFAKLADKLIENLKAKVVFIGSPQESRLIKETISLMKSSGPGVLLDASSKFKLDEIAGLMQNFKIFISVDTGPLYIANALGVAVVDIIGPFHVIEQLDLRDRCEIVTKELYCYPCVHIMPSVYTCREGHFRCTKDIIPDDVYQAVLKLKQKYDF